MRPAVLTELRFFLDRGLGAHIVPVGLRAHGWVLTTMDERYGADRSQRTADEQWISEATNRGEVLLCKDRAIARGPVEARSVYMHDTRVFTLARADLPGSERGALFLAAEQRLVRMAAHAKGPLRGLDLPEWAPSAPARLSAV